MVYKVNNNTTKTHLLPLRGGWEGLKPIITNHLLPFGEAGRGLTQRENSKTKV